MKCVFFAGTAFDPALPLHEAYDLKGSTVSRRAHKTDRVKKDVGKALSANEKSVFPRGPAAAAIECLSLSLCQEETGNGARAALCRLALSGAAPLHERGRRPNVSRSPRTRLQVPRAAGSLRLLAARGHSSLVSGCGACSRPFPPLASSRFREGAQDRRKKESSASQQTRGRPIAKPEWIALRKGVLAQGAFEGIHFVSLDGLGSPFSLTTLLSCLSPEKRRGSARKRD